MVGEFPTIYLSWPWCSGELFWIIHAIFEQHLFYRYKYRKIGNSNIFWPTFSLTDWLTELQKWSVWLVTVILKTVSTPHQDKYHRFPDGDFAIVSHPVGAWRYAGFLKPVCREAGRPTYPKPPSPALYGYLECTPYLRGRRNETHSCTSPSQLRWQEEKETSTKGTNIALESGYLWNGFLEISNITFTVASCVWRRCCC